MVDTAGLSGERLAEFERDRHFFYDSNGVDIEPVERVTPTKSGTSESAKILIKAR